jgi:hypothetical protein
LERAVFRSKMRKKERNLTPYRLVFGVLVAHFDSRDAFDYFRQSIDFKCFIGYEEPELGWGMVILCKRNLQARLKWE